LKKTTNAVLDNVICCIFPCWPNLLRRKICINSRERETNVMANEKG